MNQTNECVTYDLAIVGGGLVGASLAMALASLPLSIALIDSVPAIQQVQPDYDARSVALAHNSCQIYQSLGLLSAIQAKSQAITSVHVSELGQFGFTRISAQSLGLPALGQVIELPTLLLILSESIQSLSQITRIAPATVTGLQREEDSWQLSLENRAPIKATLVIAADGVHSPIRQQLGWPVKQIDYQQHALVANVTLNRHHNGVAYERFTKDGPLALLPLREKTMALVYTVPNAQLDFIQHLPDDMFLSLLQQRMGYRIGRFEKIGKRSIFALQLLQATQQYQPGIVAVGNAAHHLHPIAAQGFNLGLRDVAFLAQVIANALADNQSLGQGAMLDEYWRLREADQQKTIRFSNGLLSLFGNDFPGVQWLRNIGMVGLDVLPMAKQWFARYGMGAAGYSSKLARGVAIHD